MRTKLLAIVVLFITPLASPAIADTALDTDRTWDTYLRPLHFKDREIQSTDNVIRLNVPEHAEDPALVPVTVYAMLPQSDDRYIKSVVVVIDRNPVPIAGRFEFTKASGRADIGFRIRINEQTPVRAIAELNDGSLHMSRGYVNASGGCSAPIAGDLTEALARAGKMKLRLGAASIDNKPIATMLRIRHPNITGMQTVGGQYTPAHFVEKLKVHVDGELILSAETDISISEDPAFNFYVAPNVDGKLIAEVTDSQGETYREEVAVGAPKRSD